MASPSFAETSRNLWLPFTSNRQFQKDPRVIVGADGMEFTLANGRTILDGVSSLWCVAAGHNRKPINNAITEQLETLDYATAFGFVTEQAAQAAQAIAAMAPGDLNRVFFCNSGSEAADTALKLALAYHRARGEGQRTVFVGRERGFHGVNFGGMSVGGILANRKAFGAQLLPRVDHLRFPHDPVTHAMIRNQLPVWEEDLAAELENRILPLHDPSNVAAVIVEPVAGSAGWYPPPQGYLQRLREICDKHGILLIFDEVITGFGRLGANMAASYFGVVPDILNFAKIVTNGTVPLGGSICRDKVYDTVVGAQAPEHIAEFFHGYTYSGHPVATAAAVATLRLLREEKLIERAKAMSPVLSDAIHNGLARLPNVVGVRTLGLAGVVELKSLADAPGKRAFDVFLECYHQGVMVRSAGENVVLAPAFIVEKEQIERMVNVLAAAIQKHAV